MKGRLFKTSRLRDLFPSWSEAGFVRNKPSSASRVKTQETIGKPHTAIESTHILLVGDDKSSVVTLRDWLAAGAYQVELSSSRLDAINEAINRHFHLIILDLLVKGVSGLDVCRDMRERGVQSPLLILTNTDSVSDNVAALNLGADDYLTAPFEKLELLIRMETLIKRGHLPGPRPVGSFSFGPVIIDSDCTHVTKEGERVELSVLERRLLKYLVEHRGTLATREQLLKTVWHYDPNSPSRTIDVHIRSLRRKLEPDPANPRYIITVYRQGYEFVV
jgi:DNA-binding response OmpR family regulator